MYVSTDENDPEMSLGMVPSMSGYNGKEFHAWFGLVPPGAAVPGTRITGEAAQNIIVADFGMRHYRRMAEAIGLKWSRPDLPPFYWGPFSGLTALGVTLRADPIMTQKIIAEQEFDLVAAISSAALRELGFKRMAARALTRVPT